MVSKDVVKFIKALELMRDIKHSLGSCLDNQHEFDCEEILLECGFRKVEKTSKTRELDLAVKDLKSGEYISQPCGIYSNPDFVVKVDDVIFPLELKSSKRDCSPKFGNTLPKYGMIYIFTTKKSGTSIVLGQSIVSEEVYKKCIIAENAIKDFARSTHKDLGNVKHYIRMCWAAHFDFFSDTDILFDDVINFVYEATGNSNFVGMC